MSFAHLVGEPSFTGVHQIIALILEIHCSQKFDKLRMVWQRKTDFREDKTRNEKI